MSDSHVDCGGPCETPRTDPTPQPAEAVAALAEANREAAWCQAWKDETHPHANLTEKGPDHVLAHLPAGWTLTRDHARCEELRKAARAVLDWTEKELWAGPHDWLNAVLRGIADGESYTCVCGHSIGVHYTWDGETYRAEGGCPCPLPHGDDLEEWTDEGDPGPFAEGIA